MRDSDPRYAGSRAAPVRALLGPVGVTVVVVTLSAAAASVIVAPRLIPLAWLMLGLSAGYALSGSP
jgi:hypothetical protein